MYITIFLNKWSFVQSQELASVCTHLSMIHVSMLEIRVPCLEGYRLHCRLVSEKPMGASHIRLPLETIPE